MCPFDFRQKRFGNSFLDNSSDLISLGTNTLASKKQIKCFHEIKVAGKQQINDYWNKTVGNNTSSISNMINNNKFEIFLTSKLKNSLKFIVRAEISK